ncbi:MAG: DUF6724 family protein [Eggerthellaceae bacterium]
MDFASLYHFLFETFEGIGLLVLIGLTISVLACVIMEWKTRRTFKDRGPVEEDDDDFTSLTTKTSPRSSRLQTSQPPSSVSRLPNRSQSNGTTKAIAASKGRRTRSDTAFVFSRWMFILPPRGNTTRQSRQRPNRARN